MADEQIPEGPQEQPPAGAQTVPEDWQQELDQRQEALIEKLLDAASKDPGFKDRYMANPEAALQELGVADEIEAVESERPVLSDVAAQSAWYSWWYRHRHYTYRRHWHHLK